jgi:hypothetical protein
MATGTTAMTTKARCRWFSMWICRAELYETASADEYIVVVIILGMDPTWSPIVESKKLKSEDSVLGTRHNDNVVPN